MTGHQPDAVAVPFSIRLFGPFDVQLNGAPLPRLRSRKGHWLLALLALRHGREVERAWLAGTLWPDSAEEQAFLSLRISLKDLRRALGPEARRLRSPARHTLRLDLQDADADLATFDTAVAGGDPAALERAVTLYRGPLLEGCTEEWVFQEREAREEAYLRARERLAEQARERGEPELVAHHLREVVRWDAVRETAQCGLMAALAASGNYAAALEAYRELRSLLLRELNTEPAADTSALYQQIRAEARRRAQSGGIEGRRTTNDERPATNDQRPTTNVGGSILNDDHQPVVGPVDEAVAGALVVGPWSFVGQGGAPARRDVVAGAREELEPVGGAVPLDSPFYVVRATDGEFHAALARRDSIVLVKGARQVGKTSLLGRGLEQARAAGARVVLTDLQQLNAVHRTSAEAFFLAVGAVLADQLDLEVFPDQVWDARFGPSMNFSRYVRREILAKTSVHVVWGLDEVDQLATCDFGSEVFGLLRSWHNQRVTDPHAPWHRLTLAIAYATEAHLFIADVNQSPFNVGTRLELADFTPEEVADLNRRHGAPLRDEAELTRFYGLVGGHPYLVRRALYEMAARGHDIGTVEALAEEDEGVFADHLRRLLLVLRRNPELVAAMGAVLQGRPCPTAESFYRLRSAGVITGHSAREARPRCRLYGAYLARHLL